MRLNSIKPGKGATQAKKRLGRGGGSGLGKTCGRGHKGQHARTGGGVKAGFEGGQMPLQRLLPKFGFTSRQSLVRVEIRLTELMKVDAKVIDLKALRKASVINHRVNRVKVIASGEVNKAVVLKGIAVTKGARALIEAKGGKIEE